MSSTKRKPRFKRTKMRPFRLTERDMAIVEHVHRFRLLNSEHITALLGGSGQQIRRRLQLLYHARYLDRPVVQIADFRKDPRSAPMVYALGNAGADLIAERHDTPRARVNWTAKNKSLRSIYFRHTLMVSGILVAFEVACRKHGRMRVIPWGEILDTICPKVTQEQKRPHTWQVSIKGKGRMSITPDAIFGLHYLDKPAGANRAFFFLEADRATMPVMRRSLKETSIFRKLVLYHGTASQKIHTRRFGFKHFRVLTVTRSPDKRRLATMVEAAQMLDGLQGIFLFGDMRRVEKDVLSMKWVDGRGDGCPLAG